MATYTLEESGGDYSSLATFEAALPSTFTEPIELLCGNFVLTESTGVAVGGFVTTATNKLTLRSSTAARPSASPRSVSGVGFVLTGANSFGTLRFTDVDYVDLDGIEVIGTGAGTSVSYASGTFSSGANAHLIDNCIIHDEKTGTGYTLSASKASLNLTVRNSIIYGNCRTTDTRNAASALFENVTTWRHAAQLGILGDTELVCKNTYSGHTGAAAEDFYTGANAPSGNNNASSDTSVATDYTDSLTSIAGADVFVSVTSGSEDFTLKAGTNALVGAGATLGSVTEDIEGTTRPSGTGYDIGAFERIESTTSEYTILPTGSIIYQGSSSPIHEKIFISSGSIEYLGSATLLLEAGSTLYTISPTGLVSFNGSTSLIREWVRTSIGEISFTGVGLYNYTYIQVPNGDIEFNGSALLYIPGSYIPTTSMLLTGVGK